MLTTIENVLSEFWQTLRRLGKEWGFVAAFVATLALGIGANGAVFTALNAYLFQPLPYPHAGQLDNVYVGSRALSIPKGLVSAAVYKRLADAPGVASAGLYQGRSDTATVVSNGNPKSLGSVSVTASLFKTLGVQPLLGRWLDPASNRPGGPREVVVSYRFWQGALGGRRDAIGKPLKVNGKQYTVVGVMPQSFAFPDRSVLLWRSLALTPKELSLSRFTSLNWNMIVRRAPGVSHTELHTAVKTQFQRIVQRVPDPKVKQYKVYAGVMSLRQWFGGATGGRLLLLQLGAVLLLILAAANLGNLALVRMLRRRHEIGLRIALGASRLTLLRLTIAETLPLGIAAAVIGWFLSRVGAQALVHFGVASGETAFAIGAGGSVAWLGVLLSLIVAFIALSAPLLMMRSRHLLTLLKTGGRGAAGGRGSRLTRKGLSVVQIALAVMLLSGASLVGLSLHSLLTQNPGFNPDNLTVATVKLTGPSYQSGEQQAAAWRATHSAVSVLPGIRSVGLGEAIPFSVPASVGVFTAADAGRSAVDARLSAPVMVAGSDLLPTLDVLLLHGRLPRRADIRNDAHVVVVDAAFARALFGTTDVVGRRVSSGGFDWRIVGVIASIKSSSIHHNNFAGQVIAPPSKTVRRIWTGSFLTIVMRSQLPTSTVLRELKSTLAQVLPGQAIMQSASMRGLIAASAQGASALATLLIAFGIIAFVLASIGTYGVVAYLTRLRRREFSIRMTLGARSWQIEWLVLAQGTALWALGTAIGIGFAILFGHLLGGKLQGASLVAPVAYIVPALVLGIVVALASWLPARRVRRTALTETLRPQ